jgi:hypothetical protein
MRPPSRIDMPAELSIAHLMQQVRGMGIRVCASAWALGPEPMKPTLLNSLIATASWWPFPD